MTTADRATDPAPTAPTMPAPSRSRRTMLAAALGGAAAFIASALGRNVPAAQAAPGGNLIIGQSNSGGSSQTVLTSTAGGAAFALKDTTDGGTGIFGWTSATTGTGRGLYGRTDSSAGFGLQAKNLGANLFSGAAIDAQGGQNTGVQASTVNGNGYAIKATNTGSPGESPGAAINATSQYKAITASAPFAAIHGVSAEGSGVVGSTTSGRGVYGSASSGTGVYGGSFSGTGVEGNATNGIAVYGYSSFNWSGYFGIDARVENDFQVGGNQAVAGYLAVTGTVSKGGGSFKIDHPLDPEHKYLQHSFVESPDMLNVYNGLAILDAKGEATVAMPDWFHALNRDFRYQLTPHGAFSPLFVQSEMAGGRFAIAGGEPSQRVSWQVTGIRQDAWANANRIRVEEDKTGDDAGTYLHPELHGHPRSKGLKPKHPIPARPESAAGEAAPAG